MRAISDGQVSEVLTTHGRLDEIRSTLEVLVVVADIPAAYLNLDSIRAPDAFGDHALGIAEARRHERCVALLLIDLDGFKPVNDRHGHAAGDAVLRQVAQRLRSGLRAEDTVARIGGDEFVVLIEHPVTREHATHVADKLDRALREPYVALGNEVPLGASIGVALFPDDAHAPDRLLKVADDAMFAVKDARAGGARHARKLR